jgi:cysteinyl-tRNA synthetase
VHLDDAKHALTRLYTALKDVAPDSLPFDKAEPYAVRFADAMNDDFNTPVAIAVLFDLANEINKSKSPVLARQLTALAGIIALLQRSPQEFLQSGPANSEQGFSEAEIAAQIEARAAAKKEKNFAESDRIRAELLANGIILEDKPGGVTEWRRA